MSEQLQLRRGTAAQIASNTPIAGEVWVDTDHNRLIVGDGATAGGWAVPKMGETAAFTWSRKSVNANVVADTTFAIPLPPGVTRYRVDASDRARPSLSLSAAPAAVYTAASAGGRRFARRRRCRA